MPKVVGSRWTVLKRQIILSLFNHQMPATRSSSMNHRAQPLTTPSPPQKQSRCNTDTISLTSSDQELSTVKKRQDKTRLRPKKTTRIQPVEDIIEISSDDESPRNSHPSVVADYRRQLNKLREASGTSPIQYFGNWNHDILQYRRA